MRLNPPVWFTMRRALVDTEVGGYRVPAGSSVLVSAFTTHRHRSFWENPEVFDCGNGSHPSAAADGTNTRTSRFPAAGIIASAICLRPWKGRSSSR